MSGKLVPREIFEDVSRLVLQVLRIREVLARCQVGVREQERPSCGHPRSRNAELHHGQSARSQVGVQRGVDRRVRQGSRDALEVGYR